MKLLLFSDLHADREAARALCDLAAQADLAIGAGDFANAGRGLARCIAALAPIAIPTLLVPGNNETPDELRAACADWPSAQVLHGNAAHVGGVAFFGIGGGVPITPFGPWSYDMSEEEAERMLGACPPGCVLIAHSPPFGAVDLSSQGQHLGSRAIRACVERAAPRLVVCGHIHASAGQRAHIGATPVVNAGPAGLLWEL